MAKKPTKKEQKERKDKEWRELCEYIKLDILKYPESMKFPKYLALRLRGLLKGQFMANKKQKPQASYTTEQVLMACRVSKIEFQKAKVQFEDEQHKINYFMVILESKINDVVFRMQSVKKNQEKAQKLEVSEIFDNEGVEYKNKIKDKDTEIKERVAKKLKDLW